MVMLMLKSAILASLMQPYASASVEADIEYMNISDQETFSLTHSDRCLLSYCFTVMDQSLRRAKF